MYYFNIAFPLFMILVPAVVMACIPSHRSAGIDRVRARRVMTCLWAATAAAVGVWLLVYLFASPTTAAFAWMFFFPLWFGFWMPLMRAKNPDWVSLPPPDLPVRGASLKPRLEQPVISPYAIRFVWLLWGVLLGTVLVLVDWRILLSVDASDGARRSMGWTAMLVSVGMTLVPIVTALAVRMDRCEPQPLDPDGSDELIELYAKRRRQRAWLFIGFAIVMLIMHGVSSGVMALISRGVWRLEQVGTILGWGGAIVGTIVGLAGGVLGTMSTLQAARINAKLRELTQAHEPAALQR